MVTIEKIGEYGLKSIISFFIGLFFSIFIYANVILFWLNGINKLLFKRKDLNVNKLIIPTMVYYLCSFITTQNYIKIAELILVIALIYGIYGINKFFLGLTVGIFFMCLFSGVRSLGYFSFPTAFENTSKVDLRFLNNTTMIVPKDQKDAWVVKHLGYKGPATITYSIELRSEKEVRVPISLITSTRSDEFCNVKRVWSVCVVRLSIPSRIYTLFQIGGQSAWKKGDAPIEFRSIIFSENPSPSLRERISLLQFSRDSGFAFSPNAFSAQITVVGLLAIIIAPSYLWSFFVFSPSLLSIFFSGSRGALAALAVGLVFFFVARTRYYKALPWLFILTLFGIVVFQTGTIRSTSIPITIQSQTGIRSLNISDQDSARGRLEIWRLAAKAWLENPRTFLIGTGDLSAAMKVKFDARATGYGLTKDSLTHAHNLWLQTAGESGLLGLCAMLWLWAWVILRAWRSRDAGALALLAAIFVINSVDYLFFYAPVHLAFWMAAAGLKQPDSTAGVLEGSAIVKS